MIKEHTNNVLDLKNTQDLVDKSKISYQRTVIFIYYKFFKSIFLLYYSILTLVNQNNILKITSRMDLF